MWETPPISELVKAVDDPSTPIGMRMRSAYFLRQEFEKFQKKRNNNNNTSSSENIDMIVINTLSKGLQDYRHGSLLRHEFAYVMGQLRDERCCPALEQILVNEEDCTIVRHECAEALGAIGSSNSIPILTMARDAPSSHHLPEIRQTCELALNHMQWRANGGIEGDIDEPATCACMRSPYSSVDPAPPDPNHISISTETLGDVLCNETLSLFQRYRAMFSLRNRGGSDSVSALCRALVSDTSSALLRHEVAYVLGQMQHSDSIEALDQSLSRLDEHAMVRHESAEALGALMEGGRWKDCERILKKYSDDEDDIVRESCIVALDAADYWGNGVIDKKEEEETEMKGGGGGGGEEEKKDDSSREKASNFSVHKSLTNGPVS